LISKEQCEPAKRAAYTDASKYVLWEPGVGQSAGKCIRRCASFLASSDPAKCNAMEDCDFSQKGSVWNAGYTVWVGFVYYSNSDCSTKARNEPGDTELTILNKKGRPYYVNIKYSSHPTTYDFVALEQCYPMPNGVAYKITHNAGVTKYITYSDFECSNAEDITTISEGGCYAFQPYATAHPIWVKPYMGGNNAPIKGASQKIPSYGGITIIDNKQFADEQFAATMVRSNPFHKDIFVYPPWGGMPGFPSKYTMDSGVTYRFTMNVNEEFKKTNDYFWCHAQRGMKNLVYQGKSIDIEAERGVKGGTTSNIAFYDDHAMYCFFNRETWDDVNMAKFGIERGGQPFKAEYTEEAKMYAAKDRWLDKAAYEQERPFMCMAQCWKRSKHTCNDNGCRHDIVSDTCKTIDSCAKWKKIKDLDGNVGYTCAGRYKERNLVPPPPPMDYTKDAGDTSAVLG